MHIPFSAWLHLSADFAIYSEDGSAASTNIKENKRAVFVSFIQINFVSILFVFAYSNLGVNYKYK